MEMIDFGNLNLEEVPLDLTFNAQGELQSAVPRSLLAGPVLWYNSDEAARATHSNEYGSRGNQYLYPAVDQGLTREDLIAYGEEVTGHRFLKSACVECPFPTMDYLILRAQAEPLEFARSVVREMQVFRFNPRMHQYGFGTGYWVAKEHAPEALTEALRLWATRGPWRIMRMRRVVVQTPAPSAANPFKWRVDSSRCLDTLEVVEGSYAQAEAALGRYGAVTVISETDLQCLKYRATPKAHRALSLAQARELTLAGTDLRGVPYVGHRVATKHHHRFICHPFPVVELQARDLLKMPRTEEWITIAPWSITDKAANRQGFEVLWRNHTAAVQQCLF